MKYDRISLVVRQDPLIVTFGTKMFAKNGHQVHQHQYIKQKVRELARFVLEVRELDKSIQTLTDCICPTKFTLVVKAVKLVSGYKEGEGTYSTPSLALKLGHSLKKSAQYIKSEALQTQDDRMKKRAESFYELCQVEWCTEVSSQALATLHENAYNKPKRIPLAKDVKCLNIYLKEKASELSSKLESMPDEKTWRELSEVTLAQVTLFNRRRVGEMDRMTTHNYTSGMNASDDQIQEEVARSLSPLEQQLLKQMARVELRGKRGRKVAVLLTKSHKHQMDNLNKTREIGKIDPANVYQFPRSGACKTPIRSCSALRKFASKCGAKKPELLTSTCLRKHIAVITQLLNLQDNELDIVAGFMGHDIRVHREYYRLPEDTLQLVKVSKLLLSTEKGSLQQFQGKCLDDIDVTADGMCHCTRLGFNTNLNN